MDTYTALLGEESSEFVDKEEGASCDCKYDERRASKKPNRTFLKERKEIEI